MNKILASNIEGVFKTLRELDSDKASQFLKKWARNLSANVESQDNNELSENLRLLEIIVSKSSLMRHYRLLTFLLKPDSERPPSKTE